MFNFSAAVSTVEGVAGLIPAGISLINSIETSLGPNAPADTKLNLVKAGLNSVYTQFGNAEVAFESVWPHVSAVIAAYQATGLAGVVAATTPAPATPVPAAA